MPFHDFSSQNTLFEISNILAINELRKNKHKKGILITIPHSSLFCHKYKALQKYLIGEDKFLVI